MAVTSATFPQTASTAQLSQGGSTDDNDWDNPDNIKANDANYTSITSPTFDTDDCSYSIIGTNFGFSIDSGATIDGIEVFVERTEVVGEGGVQDFSAQLYNDGLIGDSQTTGTNWGGWIVVPQVLTVGGASNKWGATLTPAIVNAATFGVGYVCQAVGNNADALIDYISMKVYYTTGAARRQGIVSFQDPAIV